MKKLIVILVLSVLSLVGCSSTSAPLVQKNTTGQTSQTTENSTQQTEPQSQVQTGQVKTQSVNLYFPDDQGQYLVRVQRDVSVTDGAVVKAIIDELQKGDPKYAKVIPAEAKLLRAWVKDGIVNLDFSKEFKEKHWGGSTGESMTLYSIVNSLTDLKDIKGVQFYLDGQIPVSILGHADTQNPLVRNDRMVKP